MESKDKSLQSACMNDAEVSAFLRRGLDPTRFLECADHIAACLTCCQKLARQGDVAVAKSYFEQGLAPLVDHVPEDGIQRYVCGRLGLTRIREIDSHLAACSQCADEVRDLRGFIASLHQPHPFFLTRQFMAVASVAALALLLIVIAIFTLRRPRELIVLNDASGRVVLDARGGLEGVGHIDPDQEKAVMQAVTQQRLSFPPSLQEISGKPGALMGIAEPAAFRLQSPVGIVVQSSRPTLSWTTDPQSIGYRVILKDESGGQIVKSVLLHTTSWTVSSDLERGHTYVWQIVSSRKRGEEVTAPQPPASAAKFIVLDESTNTRLQRLPPSHLVRAVLYANAGLLGDAHRELTALQLANPDVPLLRTFVDEIQQAHADE